MFVHNLRVGAVVPLGWLIPCLASLRRAIWIYTMVLVIAPHLAWPRLPVEVTHAALLLFDFREKVFLAGKLPVLPVPHVAVLLGPAL